MKKILLIDGLSILNRAFYALPLLSTKAGVYTNAVYGFVNILLRFVDEVAPAHIAVAFDLPQPTFRHNLYGAYKGTRKGMPDELRAQVPTVKELLEAMRIPICELPGYEADDVIGTLAKAAEAQGLQPVIISGDRDLLQLASDTIEIRMPKTSKGQTTVEVFRAAEVQEKYGVTPRAFIDVKALMGDTSDNVPGVPGVGEKTATKIIQDYGSIEGALENIATLKPPRAAANLAEHRETAFLSRELVTINTAVPVELPLADVDMFNADAREMVQELELKSLLKRFEGDFPTAAPAAEPTFETCTLADLAKSDMPIAIHFSAQGVGVAWGTHAPALIVNPNEDELAAFLASPRPKLLYDAKAALAQHEIANITFDALLAAYAADPTARMKEFPAHPASAAAFILSAYESRESLPEIYATIEFPLVAVLSQMEKIGIRVDRAFIEQFGQELQLVTERLKGEIFFQIGEEFNINSPQQLGVILFEKLGLKGGRKTSRGYSTAADVLEKLANKHPIIPLIQEYRTHMKLLGTYVDGLLPLIDTDGRIRTTFRQAATDTGRLSSAEPNLQNIPVRTALGRQFRKAFIPADGCVFVDADYSQIELRLLAHISGDEVLVEAFRVGADIHRLTAARVLAIAPEDVTSEERSRAKAVNFGIIYGISAFGLSEDLKIPVFEAQSYIDGYFAKYPGVKTYLEKTVADAKENGYVQTMFGRRRPMPELTSHIYNTRQFGERVAMNMPIQGSAADIIKLAMINVHARLARENLQTRLVLQVHDELLLEASQSEAEIAARIIKEEMENVCELAVPLVADVNVGASWYDTK
jgi:DNA polymerase-1